MHRALLPAVARSLAGFLLGLVLPMGGFGQGGEGFLGGAGSRVLPEQAPPFSTRPSMQLWRPSSPWEKALPPDAVIGSWEAARLWELNDQQPMLALEGKSPSPATESFAWPGASPTHPPDEPHPTLPDPGALFPPPRIKDPAARPESEEARPRLGAPGTSPPGPAPPAETPNPEKPGPQHSPPPESSGKSKQQAPPSETGVAEEKGAPREQKHAPVQKQARKNDTPDSAEEVPPGVAKVEVPPQSTSWFSWPPVLEHWNARFKAGMDGTAGNNQRFTTRLGLDVDHKDPRFVWSSQLDYVVTTSSGEQIENEAIWDGRFERLNKENPTGWFVHSNVEYDRFTAFDVRITLDGGLSYYFVRDPDLSFKGRMAGGTSREFGVPGAEYIPEFSYGLELQWKPNQRHELKAKTDVFSDVRDFSDFRATTRATWRVQVDSADRVGLQFELLNRYDSTPNGKKKYDLTYSVQLVWDL